MVSQAEVNGRNGAQPAAAGMRHGVLNFAHDLWSLGELQCQLLYADLKEATSRAVSPLIFFAVGAAFAFAGIPMFVVALGWLLVHRAGLSHEAAFAMMGFVSLIVAGGLIWFAWSRLQASIQVLARSRDELGENFRWIKQSLGDRNAS